MTPNKIHTPCFRSLCIAAVLSLFIANSVRAERIELSDRAAAAIDAITSEVHGRQAAVIAPTGSMFPALKPSQIAIVQPKDFKELSVGDIVVFTDGVQTVSHRVYKKFRQGCTTKGDALKSIDPRMMTQANYLGMVVVATVDRSTGEVSRL